MRAAELVARAGHPLAARALMARRGKNDRRDFISRSGARAGCAFVLEPLGLAQHPAGDGPSRTMAKPQRDAGDLARWLPLDPPAADSTGIVFCATVFREAISKPKQPSTARSGWGVRCCSWAQACAAANIQHTPALSGVVMLVSMV